MASEIIRREENLATLFDKRMTFNPLPSYQQTTGQWRFNEGMVTCRGS